MPLRVERSVGLKLLLGTLPVKDGVKLIGELQDDQDRVVGRWLSGPIFPTMKDATEAADRAVVCGLEISTEGGAEWLR